MSKAFVCAWVEIRLYIRSGRIVFPLLILLGYPMVFYNILPVDVLSSFSMSSIEAFAWGAWVAISMVWSEDKTLRQVLIVKAGRARYTCAQNMCLMLFGALGGLYLVIAPLLAYATYLPHMFVQAPDCAQIALAFLLNAAAGVCGAAFGAIFRPRLVHDRKLAYLLCLLLGVLGLAGGIARFPIFLRLLLPPMYDSITAVSDAGAFTAYAVLPFLLWYLLYSAACFMLQTVILQRTEA